MDGGDSDHSSNNESVHNSNNEWDIDLITPGDQHPLPVLKKPKRFWSRATKIFKRDSKKSGKQNSSHCEEFTGKNDSIPKYWIHESIVTNKSLHNPKKDKSLNKGVIQSQSSYPNENFRNKTIPIAIVSTEYKNVPFNCHDTQSDLDLPTDGSTYGPGPNMAITPVNVISHNILAQYDSFEAENSFNSVTEKQKIIQMPTVGSTYGPGPNMAITPANAISHNILAQYDSLEAENSFNSVTEKQKINQMPRESIELQNFHGSIRSIPPTVFTNTHLTTFRSGSTSDHNSTTLENVNLKGSCMSSSAPLTQNILASESGLPSCQLNNLVGHVKHKEQPDTPSEIDKLLKPPVTSVNAAQLGIGVTDFEDPESALEFGEAIPSTYLNPIITNSLKNPNIVQNKLTDLDEKVLLKNPVLENPDVDNAISDQSISISRETLKNDMDIFDNTKAQYYAYVLRNLPGDRLREVEKAISGILVHSQISAATGLDESQAISMWHAPNKLPSISKKYLREEPDIFDTKAQWYVNIYRNLPKEKFEEVDKDISHILIQAQQIAAWEKSQENLNGGFTRKSLPDILRQSRLLKQGSSPRNRKGGSKLDKSPTKEKQLYPLISEFNGDRNEEEYEDFSYEEHENEEYTDDASEEEIIINEELPYKPPKKTVTGTHHVQWQPSPRISKLTEAKAVPKLSTSYKYVKAIVCTLVVLLCAIAAAFFGAPYWPTILEMFSKTNSSQPVANIIQNLQNEFGEQPPMTFKVINIALSRVTKPNPEQPAIILLLVEQGAEGVAQRFARTIADSVASSNNVVLVSGHTYNTTDLDEAKKEIDDLLKENLSTDRLEVVLVERLDYIPPEVAIIFHTYCDHENATFKRVVYLMTIASNKAHLKSLTTKDWDFIAHEHLSEVWSKGGNDQISSLLSRLTVSVAAIVPGG